VITVIEGRMGTGKTLILAKLAKADLDRGREIYAKAPFAFKGWEEFSLDSQEDFDNYEDCSIYLDEAYIFVDASSSQTRTNKLMACLIAQSGRREVDLYLSTPELSYLDKKIRKAVDTRVLCHGLVQGKTTVSITDMKTGAETRSFVDLTRLYALIETTSSSLTGLYSSDSNKSLDFIKEALNA